MTTIGLTFYATGSTKNVTLHFGQFFLFVFVKLRSVSVNSKPDHPPRATPWDSHVLVAPGVGFSLFCLARGSALGFARGVLNQSKSSIILEKSAILALSLKQLICLYMIEVSSVT